MQLSIIIPTKDRGSVFDETLMHAVKATAHLHAEIIVVNDSKNSCPKVPPSYANVKLINNPKPGVASARNTGVKQSNGTLLLFLDDDIVISRASLDHIIEVHEQLKSACLNVNWEYPPETLHQMSKTQFGRFMIAHQLTTFKGWYADPSWQDNALFTSKSVASFHLSMTRENFNKTNGYNEQFPHAGFEDYDFPLQLKKAGLAFYIDTRVMVFHNEFDRLELRNWMNSQERRAVTRRVGVEMGYNNLQLKYSPVKRAILGSIAFCFKAFLSWLALIPNIKFFDPLYFRLVAIMQASRIYKGYTSTK